MVNFLPWLALCLLFLLKSNRFPQAWWVWAATLASALMRVGARPLLESSSGLPGQIVDSLLDVASVLAFALTGLWLVARVVSSKYRIVAFLATLAVLAVFAGVAVVAGGATDLQVLPILVVSGLAVGALALALHLTGWLCRRQYGPVRFLLYQVLSAFVSAGLVLGPFCLFAIAIGGEGITWRSVIVAVLVGAVFLLLNVLPFVGLSLVNSFYRERIKDLLHCKPAELPAGTAPLPPLIVGATKDLVEKKIIL